MNTFIINRAFPLCFGTVLAEFEFTALLKWKDRDEKAFHHKGGRLIVHGDPEEI